MFNSSVMFHPSLEGGVYPAAQPAQPKYQTLKHYTGGAQPVAQQMGWTQKNSFTPDHNIKKPPNYKLNID